MIRRCANAGLPEPEFEVARSFVTRIWRAAPAGQAVSFTSRDSEMSEIREKPVATPEVAGQATGQVTGQPESQHIITPGVTPEVMRFLSVIEGTTSRQEIQTELGIKDEKHFREFYQQPAVTRGLIEMTIPEKPTSRLQKYRLTNKGHAVIANLKSSNEE